MVIIVPDILDESIASHLQSLKQIAATYLLKSTDAVPIREKKNSKNTKAVISDTRELAWLVRRFALHDERESTSMGIVSPMELSTLKLNELDQCFMYSQLIKEILLQFDHGPQAIVELAKFCRTEDPFLSGSIAVFESSYDPHSPIWWYTKEWFIYFMVNRALRLQNIESILMMAFFLRDLHEQIAQIHSSYDDRQCFVVYRGQGMSNTVAEKLVKNKGGLLSFNHFLSTSTDYDTSLSFAESTRQDPTLTGTLFRIQIDPSIPSAPYAKLDNLEETDVRLWFVNLELTRDHDAELAQLTEYIREETGGPTLWRRLGVFMMKTGEFEKAKEIYVKLLQETLDHHTADIASISHQLGTICHEMGDSTSALSYYQTSIKLFEQGDQSNQSSIATTFANVAQIYRDQGDYSQALSFYEKTLSAQNKLLPPAHLSFATTFNNIEVVMQVMGTFSNALKFFEKALALQMHSLPAIHPSIGVTQKYLGSIHKDMGNCGEASACSEKVLKIQEKSLPPMHATLASTHGLIGENQQLLGDYQNALLSYGKMMNILQLSLPPNHPLLASSYSLIGLVHRELQQYSAALGFYQKALEIQQLCQPIDHADLATTFNNMGCLFLRVREYSIALNHFQKALDIQETSLAPVHPKLVAITYGNLGGIQREMDNYAAALVFYETALNAQEKSCSLDHLATTYNNIALVYQIMGDYHTALTFYGKHLECVQKSEHPDLTTVYQNIATVHFSIGMYSTALSFLETTVELLQETFSTPHSSLAIAYSSIGEVITSLNGEKLKRDHFFRKITRNSTSIISHECFACSQDTHRSLSMVHISTDDYPSATRHAEQAYETLNRTFGEEHRQTQVHKDYLAQIRGEFISVNS